MQKPQFESIQRENEIVINEDCIDNLNKKFPLKTNK